MKNYFKLTQLSNGNTLINIYKSAEGGVAGLFSAPCRRFSNIAIFLPRNVELKNVSTAMLFLPSIKLLITVLRTYFCCRVLLCTCWIPWAGPAGQWCRGIRWRRAPPPHCCTSPPPSAGQPGSTSLPPAHTSSETGSGSFHQRAKKNLRKTLISTILWLLHLLTLTHFPHQVFQIRILPSTSPQKIKKNLCAAVLYSIHFLCSKTSCPLLEVLNCMRR